MNRIKEYRKKNAYSQAELAKLIGVTPATMSRYESEEIVPPRAKVEAIAKILGTTPSELLGEIPGYNATELRQLDYHFTYEDAIVPVGSDNIYPLIKRAKGICELCRKEPKFIVNHGRYFLEPHFVTWLSDGGMNSADNIVVLCPNCHKYAHMYPEEYRKRLMAILRKRHEV